MEYKLEIKQVVEYPRSRIYREFIRELMRDKNINTLGCSYLFYFTVLSSYANFRSSYKNIEGTRFMVCPGEWICSVKEMQEWFRCKSKNKLFGILDTLQSNNFIEYSEISRKSHIKFKICKWKKHNTFLEYNAPCQKTTGFFFLSIAQANELISLGRCSEMDIILDLWLNTIYNDNNVKGSDIGPVVYIRNGSGNPMTTNSNLSVRYGVSRSSINRILTKFNKLKYIKLITYSGRNGSVIYIENYLSTMFNISDVSVDKDEVSFALNLNITTNENEEESMKENQEFELKDEQICVSKDEISVPFSHIKEIVKKTAKTLALYGFSCCECERSSYILSKSYDCKRNILLLDIYCTTKEKIYSFELIIKEDELNGGMTNER